MMFLLGVLLGILALLLLLTVRREMELYWHCRKHGWYYCPWFLLPCSWWVNRKYDKG